MTRDHERRVFPVLMAVAATLLSACFGGEPATGDAGLASADDAIEGAREGLHTTASITGETLDRALSDVGDTPVAAAVIPSDDAVLNLDADRLADLMSTNSIDDLVLLLSPSDDIDLQSEAALDREWEGFLFDTEGDAHLTRTGTEDATFAGLPILGIEEQAGLTVIVVDGIVERRDESE